MKQSVMPTALERRIAALHRLTEPEREALAALQRDVTQLPAKTRITAEGAPLDRVAVVRSGWVMRSRTLPDGRRQVFNIAVSGDVLGLEAIAFRLMPCDLTTLSPTEVSFASVDVVASPPLEPIFSRLILLEQAMLSERLLSIGRRTAIERVGHLLLELWHRLRLVELASDDAMPMPLNQEIIGDALGLSAAHVNRTLQRLQHDDLIEVQLRRPRAIRILDAPKLERLARFKGDYLLLSNDMADEQQNRPQNQTPGSSRPFAHFTT